MVVYSRYCCQASQFIWSVGNSKGPYLERGYFNLTGQTPLLENGYAKDTGYSWSKILTFVTKTTFVISVHTAFLCIMKQYFDSNHHLKNHG